MRVAKAITTKRAVRTFKKDALVEKEIHAILNAGRRAQSSKNRQAWQFIAVQDKELLKKLLPDYVQKKHLRTRLPS